MQHADESVTGVVRSRLVEGLDRYQTIGRNRSARVLVGSTLVSEIGDWFNIVALIALSHRFSDNVLSVGVMLALRTVPRLLFQVPAGALVDRARGSTRLLVAVQLAMAFVACSFALLEPFPDLYLLYTLVFVLEALGTVAWPAYRTQVMQHVPTDQRGAANGLLALCVTVGAMIGPLIGSAVLATSGSTPVFLANGATFALNALVVARVAQRSPTPFISIESSTLEAVAGGYRVLARRRDLAAYSLLQIAVTMLVQASISLFVVRAIDLGLGDYGTGWFYSVVAVGALAGGLVAGLGRHRERRAVTAIALSLGLAGLALAGFGATSELVVALGALAIAGSMTQIGEVVALTYFQHRLPDSAYGRFLSIFLIALSLGGLIGVLAGPLLADEMGTGTALAILAIPVVVLSGAVPIAARFADDVESGGLAEAD